jgi:DNA-directed RNA polymerase
MNTAILSEQATVDRFNAAQARVERDFGYGQGAGALAIAQVCVERLASSIQDRITTLKDLHETAPEKSFLKVIRNLPTEIIALSALDAALNAVAVGTSLLKARIYIGQAINGEAWAAGLLEEKPQLAKRIDRAVRRRHGSLKYRAQAARSIAHRAAFMMKKWTPTQLQQAGSVLLNCLLEALPDIFEVGRAPDTDVRFLTITDGAQKLAEHAIELALRRAPVFLPCTTPPKPWTGFYKGGFWDERTRLRTSVVRTYHKETKGAIRAAIRDGSMQPHLDALNALQATAWSINTKVLDVLQWAYDNSIPVPGLPPKEDCALPVKPCAWESMDDAMRRLWKYRTGQVKERNRSYTSERVLFASDTITAQRLADAGRYWTPLNCDWRGRVYGICHFNFQRDDRVRALFLFADGQPIGEEGLRWLKIHVATVGDFNKISKRSLEEREAWTNANVEKLLLTASEPTTAMWWTFADKPFLFLAAIMELSDALHGGASWSTRLPVSFDGSCSGLQHLAAMTRDAKTASLVNLTKTELPQDVYQTVADNVTSLVVKDAEDTPPHASAGLALKHGIDRKMVKRNVMTYSYSSKKFGMAQQLTEDLMRPLAFDVLSGKLDEHPFGADDGRPAAKYLAGHIYDAIEQLVTLPAQAMVMLQKCARALAHEGKPLTWTTPLGLPWINRYHAPVLKRVGLWLRDTRVRATVAEGNEKEIDKGKSANGVAPNFVHALDAAHLLMTTNACVSENITQLATVHDSFGCLAPQATRFNQIIREQFVELYGKRDVLNEVLVSARHDLTLPNQQRLPIAPEYGTLDLKEVIHADFAFA